MSRKRRSDDGVHFEQGPGTKRYITDGDVFNVLRSIIFFDVIQLMPIWVMALIGLATEHGFPIKDYSSNILVFDVVTCMTILFELYRNDSHIIVKSSMETVTFVLMSVLCLALSLYCLLLLEDININNYVVLTCSLLFLFIVILISILDAIKKENEKEKETINV